MKKKIVMLMLAAALAATAVAGCGKNNISQEQTTEAENSNRIYGVMSRPLPWTTSQRYLPQER